MTAALHILGACPTCGGCDYIVRKTHEYAAYVVAAEPGVLQSDDWSSDDADYDIVGADCDERVDRSHFTRLDAY